MIKNNKKGIFVYLPFVFGIVLVIGLLIGHYLLPAPTKPTFMIYPQKNKISKVFRHIEDSYVDSVSKNELEELVINNLLNELDPHSVYIPADQLKKVNEPLVGGFSGIGIQFNMQNDTVAVINTIPNGPSVKVGILAGDRIIKVNDSLVAGVKMSTDQIVSQLKGKRGTKVKVSIKRRGVAELIDFVITRDNIPLFSVDVSYMLKENIGYIKISKFSKTTFNEFKAAVESLKQSGMESLVLDLRGNSGGYLDAATRIADQFLDRGNLIVYTKGRMRSRQEYRANQGGVVASDKVVVLIDEWSASASEILAGAIQDNDRGTIVGRRSFGKGLVQEPFRLFDGSAIRLTTARYYTPTGRCIQKPYKKGSEDYYHELQDRYEKGEFLEKDSIHFADSLKYMTPGGKIVYGGGGIMPDVFVPLDTSSTSEYLTKIKNKGLIYKYAFQYADQKREILSEIETYQKMVQYLNNQNVLNLFVDFAQEKGIQPIPADIAKSKELLEIQLNAYIIRNILDNEGFYPVIHRVDNTLKKAIELAED